MAPIVRAIVAVALHAALASGRVLRHAPPPAASPDLEVGALRAKLERMSAGLATLLDPAGTLAKTKVAAEMKTFLAGLKQTLKETASEKDTAKALKKLKGAESSVHTLTQEMTQNQMRLMKEDENQKVNLLLGVLNTRQKEPMSKQLEVLNSPDFASLEVVKAVLAAKDSKTPLLQQVGAWLDKHSDLPGGIPDKLTMGKNGKPEVTKIVQALQVRLDSLEDHFKNEQELHSKEMKEIDAAEKKAAKSPRQAHRIEHLKKKEERKYAKQSALDRHDIESMKAAIGAVQRGDMKALKKAQAALAESYKAMQAQNGGFLYLIQLGHRSQSLDCPYCAAQCFDKCHAAGKSYTTCLTDCADAGK